jgi:glycosyltransferase involved in cell wall biosynthesis
VDITPVVEQKKSAIQCFRSQLEENDYLSKILGLNRYRAYFLPAGVQCAEAFWVASPTATPHAPLDHLFAQLHRLPPKEASQPLVSLVVRTKDRPKLLRRALQSIAAQDYRPIEVVLVNDGETITDLDALEKMISGIPLRYLENGRRGRTAAANLGLTKSEGLFVSFLDDDDVLYSDHVSTLVHFLKESDYKVAYTETYFVHTEYDPINKVIFQTQKYPAPTMDFSRETLLFYNYIPFMCLMFERGVLETVGGFDEAFDICEDWDLTIRISRKFPFCHIKKITSEYSIWSRDLQSIQNNEKLLAYRKKIYKKYLTELSPDLISAFIFNGYWINLKYLEDRINALAGEIAKKDEEIQKLQMEGRRSKEESLQFENENTIKFPTIFKSVLRALLMR